MSQSDDAEAEDFGVFYNPKSGRFEPLACPVEQALEALELLRGPGEKAPHAQERRNDKAHLSQKMRARIALANRLNYEREIGPMSAASADYLTGYVEDPEQADARLCSAIISLAIKTYDQDFVRLAYLNAAYSGRWVASDYGEGLPDKAGMASALAISTIMACGWTQNPDGTWRSDKRLASRFFAHDPVDAGKTWRKRLARKLRDREKNGVSSELDDLMSLILRTMSLQSVKVADPQSAA